MLGAGRGGVVRAGQTGFAGGGRGVAEDGAGSLRERGLRVFVADPRVPPDNNAAERGLRGPVIGRLTSFGSGSDSGTELTGLLFSVLSTVRLAGLNPYA